MLHTAGLMGHAQCRAQRTRHAGIASWTFLLSKLVYWCTRTMAATTSTSPLTFIQQAQLRQAREPSRSKTKTETCDTPYAYGIKKRSITAFSFSGLPTGQVRDAPRPRRQSRIESAGRGVNRTEQPDRRATRAAGTRHPDRGARTGIGNPRGDARRCAAMRGDAVPVERSVDRSIVTMSCHGARRLLGVYSPHQRQPPLRGYSHSAAVAGAAPEGLFSCGRRQ